MPAARTGGGPAAFLDRDGTLIADPGYVGDPAAVVLLPGAAAAVAALAGAGFTVVVVSNQSGVARGLFDEEAVAAVNRRVAELLLREDPGARLAAFYVCPHLPREPGDREPPTALRRDCDCRKPRPGLLLRAAAELDLDLARSVGIGDSPRDVEAFRAAGCPRALRIGPESPHRSLAAAVAALLARPPLER